MITRRKLIRLGTTAAVAGVVAPFSSPSEVPAAPSSPSHDICFQRATDLAAMIREKKLSAVDAMQAHLRQIARVNPKVNAFVTLLPEETLLSQAKAADESVARGEKLGPLQGLPVAVKDLTETKGIRTTFGSPLYKDNVPDHNAIVVERMKAAGAIVIGKTNVPEFGLGSQTFNPVFGPTLNPYDLSKTCGGSTGGGAVALACGMAPIVNGSDMGGSLRNPGNFCNVVGIRPSPGRVPSYPSSPGWFTLSVDGPMARNVTDCALLLSVQAGFDRRSPIAIDEDGRQFAGSLERNFKGTRVAMFQDLGLPWETGVRETIHAQRKVLESLGCIVEDAEPDMSDANECFLVWRHWNVAQTHGAHADQHPDMVNEYVHWHVEEGRKLSGVDLAQAEAKRTALYHRMRQFLERYEFWFLPVNQVWPFDVKTHYPAEIAEIKMESYMAWMKSAYYVSAVGNPAMSVPCGFSAQGLPIGIQIVGRHHDDWGVLQMGYAFEQATNIGSRRPGVATPEVAAL